MRGARKSILLEGGALLWVIEEAKEGVGDAVGVVRVNVVCGTVAPDTIMTKQLSDDNRVEDIVGNARNPHP